MDKLSESPIKEIIKRVVNGEDFELFVKEGLITIGEHMLEDLRFYCTCYEDEHENDCCKFIKPIKLVSYCFSREFRQYIYDNCDLGLHLNDSAINDEFLSELAIVQPKMLYFNDIIGTEIGYPRIDGKIYPRYYKGEDFESEILDFSECVMVVTHKIVDASQMPKLKCIYTIIKQTFDGIVIRICTTPEKILDGTVILEGECNNPLIDAKMRPFDIYMTHFHNSTATKSARK